MSNFTEICSKAYFVKSPPPLPRKAYYVNQETVAKPTPLSRKTAAKTYSVVDKLLQKPIPLSREKERIS